MHRNLLNKQFFQSNPVKQNTAQQFVYSTLLTPAIMEAAQNVTRQLTNRAENERKILEKETNPKILLKMMRGKCDVINKSLLYKKVLEMEEELVPQIIDMFGRSLNNVFIENSINIIAQCEKSYSKEIISRLEDIRSPYGLSLACILLGIIGDEDIIPLIYDKYFELKKLYPETKYSYAQGPLISLYELAVRFDYIK